MGTSLGVYKLNRECTSIKFRSLCKGDNHGTVLEFEIVCARPGVIAS